MTKLYSSLAGIYHEMYRNIFDYESEFRDYDSVLRENNCHTILEIACGSGMLAGKFMEGGYDYTGLDLYDEMLEIARFENPSGKFIREDMRDLKFQNEFDAVLITGRSLDYIIDNKDILNTFKGIYTALIPGGIFVFGLFDAQSMMPDLKSSEQEIVLENKVIRRTNHLILNLVTGWTYDWHARYEVEQDGKIIRTDDITTLRTFTEDEIRLFLKLSGFTVVDLKKDIRVLSVTAKKPAAEKEDVESEPNNS